MNNVIQHALRQLAAIMLCLAPSAAYAQAATEEPIITFKTNIYEYQGAENNFHIVLGASSTDYYDVDCGFGATEEKIGPYFFNDETQTPDGTSVQCRVSADGIVKIYGDASKITFIDCEGCYLDWIDISKLVNLEVVDLGHNELKRLDLSPLPNLYAVYLSDNPFTAETPLVVGSNHPQLAILEIDIIDHLDQSFNLSDYPEMVAFDGYHNLDLRNLDPTGCPKLSVLSAELTPVASLDVSKNPELIRLNISDSRITEIDVTKNSKLLHFLAQHSSGSINTDIKLNAVDVTNNPLLQILNLDGNTLTEIDLSANTNLTNLSLRRNQLREIDLTNNTNLYSVDLSLNYFNFATLPAPQLTWGEYFYEQKPLPCNKSYPVGGEINFAEAVLRPQSTTTVAVYEKPYDREPQVLEPTAYTYANGIVTFNEAPTDSCYIVFTNSMFDEYRLQSDVFKVKSTADFGQPSNIISFTADASATPLKLKVGLDGATEAAPATFYMQVDGSEKLPFTATSATAPDQYNVELALPSASAAEVVLYVPEGNVLTAFAVDGCNIKSVDVSRATQLRTLSITNCGLTDIDLRYNRCLTDLDLQGNSLTSLSLAGIYGNYEKFALHNVNAANNSISEFTVVSPQGLRALNLSHNNLETLLLKDYDGMQHLNLSYNQLSGDAMLTYMGNCRTLDISHNNFTSTTIPTEGFPFMEQLNLSNNALTLATLPYPELPNDATYTYAPQEKLFIAAKAPAVNLSNQSRTINGHVTTFTWMDASTDTPLQQGVDLECDNGATRFLQPAIGKTVYCCMTHAAFPAFTGNDAFVTTGTEVVDKPSKVVASFTCTESTDQAEVIFTGYKPTSLFIDWRGDGTEYKQYDMIADTYTVYPGQQTYKGAQAKVYTYEDAADVKVFSIYGVKMAELDASALTNLTGFSIGGAGLSEANTLFPSSDAIREINLNGNNFSTKDFSEFTKLQMLNLGNNAYETFNAALIPQLEILHIDQNNLSSITLGNNKMWELSASGNKLTDIDFSQARQITQLNLAQNEFEQINVKPLASKLVVLMLDQNRLTFATLPRLSAMYRLQYYTYGNQAEIEIECIDGKVDLSAQDKVDGLSTAYRWYLGNISYDYDSGTILGEEIDGTGDDPEYTIENGITTFHYSFNEDVRCLLTNGNFPNMVLYTKPVTVHLSGVENVSTDNNDDTRPVDVYTLSGMLLRKGVTETEATKGLATGIYVVGNRKVAVK